MCVLVSVSAGLNVGLVYAVHSTPQSRGKVRVSAQRVDEKASSVLSLGLDVEHSGLCHGTEKRKKKKLTITDSGQKEETKCL